MNGEYIYECIVKETEKARLVRVSGVDVWIPKSAFMWIKEDERKFLLHDWFAKDLIDEGCIYSEDRKHIYMRWRFWNKNLPYVLAIGLNPKADHKSPTIERLSSIFSRKGYGGFRMVNLFTVITHSPTVEPLLDPDRCGDMKGALGLIFAYSINAAEVIFCWGTFDEAKERAEKCIEFYTDALCFGKNRDGSPWHPMMLHYAGLTNDKVELFKFKDHVYEKNKYDRKERKKKMHHNEKQMSIIPNEVIN